MTDAMQKLAAMRHLPPGWGSYKARMINRAAINHAQWLLSKLPGNWTAVPCANGDVQLEQHEGGFDIELRISVTEKNMTDDERKIILHAIDTLKSVGTGHGEDCDDAYMRCALRMLAEVCGLSLEGYRLLKEVGKPVKPLYFAGYRISANEGDEHG